MQTKCKVVNGTSYHKETKDEVIEVLENARAKRTRLHFEFGDPKTGKNWNEENDVDGYIGRSTGIIKIPLLIKNSRSTGGGVLLDNCIIAIYTSKGKEVLYKRTYPRSRQFKKWPKGC